jgi:RimJ/RimL family protein N-acetyltransferase
MLNGEFTALRAIERADLPTLLEWRNRPDYRRYFREVRELSLAQQQQWYDNVVLGDPNTRMFTIIEKDSKRLLGACGLCYIDWLRRSADFSIYVGADNLYIDGKFAPDAARTMMEYGYGELNLHRLWAEIYDFDDPKKRLFDILGFKLDGRFRDNHWAEGRWHDSLFYSRLSTD